LGISYSENEFDYEENEEYPKGNAYGSLSDIAKIVAINKDELNRISVENSNIFKYILENRKSWHV